jgi:hypothetical protein
MMLLAAIASFTFVFAAFVLSIWHSLLDMRVALAAVAVLLRLNELLDWNLRGGGK